MGVKHEPIDTYEAIKAITRCIASLNPIGGKVRVEMPLVAERCEDGEIGARVIGDVTFSFDLKCDEEGCPEEDSPTTVSFEAAKEWLRR